MSEEVGKRLKKLRLSKKMSQQELSDRTDIVRSTISNYEVGRRTPHLKDLEKFCKAFGVGLDYFGVAPIDDALDLLARAQEVFSNPEIDVETKEDLYKEFMKLYLSVK